MTDAELESIVQEWLDAHHGSEYFKAYAMVLARRVREAEREACAEIAEDARRRYMGPQGGSVNSQDMNIRAADACKSIAAAIRNQGKDTNENA